MIKRIDAGGPVLLFGGPYSNLEATQALLAEAARRGIPPSRVICTGDVVAYCADARATLDLVIQSGIHVVKGNCEDSLAAGAPDCGCGFSSGSACDLMSAQWFAYAAQQVRDDQRAFMAALPARIDLEIGGRRLAVVHGGLDAIAEYIFASAPQAEKVRQIAASGADGVIGGHCGLPFTQRLENGLWHNPGVIGMPANDGTPRAWCSVLTPEGDGLRVTHHALDYDHECAARKMRDAGLPEGYASALSSGLWPSLDVLPECERRATGAPLQAREMFWPARRAASASS